MFSEKLSKLTQVLILIFIGTMIFFISCNQEGKGFALPPGDIEVGKTAFVNMSCNECHSTSDVEWIGNDKNIHIKLGGPVSIVKTYGDLVTSVINPSHKIAKQYEGQLKEGEPSPMYNYNELITIQELVDVVTYLQNEYDIVTPEIFYFPY